jgi:hypothetical protein
LLIELDRCAEERIRANLLVVMGILAGQEPGARCCAVGSERERIHELIPDIEQVLLEIGHQPPFDHQIEGCDVLVVDHDHHDVGSRRLSSCNCRE